MAYILDKEGMFECKPSNQGVDSGNGIFCKEDTKAGTILPYYAIAFKEEDEDESYAEPDEVNEKRKRISVPRNRTYVMSAEYTTKSGNERTMRDMSTDGNPSLDEIKCLETYKQLACQINEASKGFQPNCLFTGNNKIGRKQIKDSFKDGKAIPIIYVVLPYDLKKGDELLTTYGSHYSERSYVPCKMKRKVVREMVDICYDFVEKL